MDENEQPGAEPAAAEQSVDSQAQSQVEGRNYEAEAREMGWVPEAEFRGDKARWKPADKFVEDGEKILPIVRAENRKLREELRLVRDDFATRVTRMERMSEATRERERENYEAQIASIKAAQVRAVESGDTAEFQRLDKARDNLDKRQAAAEKIVVDEGPTGIQKAEQDFAKANAWYGVDDDMTAIAARYSQKLAVESNNTLPIEDNLRKTEAYMRQKYPALYGQTKPAANGHAAVDGGGSLNGASSLSRDRNSLASKLPAEAKAQAEKDIKAGLYKDAESWAKIYYS